MDYSQERQQVIDLFLRKNGLKSIRELGAMCLVSKEMAYQWSMGESIPRQRKRYNALKNGVNILELMAELDRVKYKYGLMSD